MISLLHFKSEAIEMKDIIELKPIARVRSDFKSKFGIPRQSGLAEELKAEIVFESEYRNREYLRGIEGYSHLWILWGFSANKSRKPTPTVRPPRLGGNRRVGVFATRSPYRPNPIGLSAVRIDFIEETQSEGMIIHINGADIMDGTPVYDIKPYIPEYDSLPDAARGFASDYFDYSLKVEINEKELAKVEESRRNSLIRILELDPRPSYQDDPERIYCMDFADYSISFRVNKGTLFVEKIEHLTK